MRARVKETGATFHVLGVVSDRLPDNDEEVLVYYPICKEWELAIAFYDERLGEFWTTEGWKVHPTYWQPIELPEEE